MVNSLSFFGGSQVSLSYQAGVKQMLDEGVLALLKVKSLDTWMVEKLEMERTKKYFSISKM